MNLHKSKKIYFAENIYNPVYSIIYSDQNLATEIIFYDEDEDFYEEDDLEDYEEIELPILELPGAEEYEA